MPKRKKSSSATCTRTSLMKFTGSEAICGAFRCFLLLFAWSIDVFFTVLRVKTRFATQLHFLTKRGNSRYSSEFTLFIVIDTRSLMTQFISCVLYTSPSQRLNNGFVERSAAEFLWLRLSNFNNDYRHPFGCSDNALVTRACTRT